MRFLHVCLVLFPAIHAFVAALDPISEENAALRLADAKLEPSGSNGATLSTDFSIGMEEFPDKIDLQVVLNEPKGSENHTQIIRVEVPESTLNSLSESNALNKLVENVGGLLMDTSAVWDSLSSSNSAQQLINLITGSEDHQNSHRVSPKEIDADEPDIFDTLVTAMDTKLYNAINRQSHAQQEVEIDADLPDDVNTLATAISQQLASKDFGRTHEAEIEAENSDISMTPFALDGEQLMQTLMDVVEGFDAAFFANENDQENEMQTSTDVIPKINTHDTALDFMNLFSSVKGQQLEQSLTEAFPKWLQIFGQPMVDLFDFLQSNIESDALLQMPEVRWSSSLDSPKELSTKETADACTLIIDAQHLHGAVKINVQVEGSYVLIRTNGSFDQSKSSDEYEERKDSVTFSMLTADDEPQDTLGSKLRGAKISTISSIEIPVPTQCSPQNPRVHTEENSKWASLIFTHTHVEQSHDQTHTHTTTYTHTYTSENPQPMKPHQAPQLHYLQHNAIHMQALENEMHRQHKQPKARAAEESTVEIKEAAETHDAAVEL